MSEMGLRTSRSSFGSDLLLSLLAENVVTDSAAETHDDDNSETDVDISDTGCFIIGLAGNKLVLLELTLLWLLPPKSRFGD